MTQWDWNFGDGASSSERNPRHGYANKGIYKVCLIAANKNGSDTLCRTLYVGTSSMDQPNDKIKIEHFPNPCAVYLMVNVQDCIPEKMILSIMDLHGKEVLNKRIYEGSNGIDVHHLCMGVYILIVKEKGNIIKTDRITVIR